MGRVLGIAAALSVFMVSSCAQPVVMRYEPHDPPVISKGKTALEDARLSFDRSLDGMRAFNSESGCDGDGEHQAESGLDGIRSKALVIATYDAFAPEDMAGSKFIYMENVATLALADMALRKGCLDIADRNYRGVATSPIASTRERAKMGVEDVREARRKEDAKAKKVRPRAKTPGAE